MEVCTTESVVSLTLLWHVVARDHICEIDLKFLPGLSPWHVLRVFACSERISNVFTMHVWNSIQSYLEASVISPIFLWHFNVLFVELCSLQSTSHNYWPGYGMSLLSQEEAKVRFDSLVLVIQDLPDMRNRSWLQHKSSRQLIPPAFNVEDLHIRFCDGFPPPSSPLCVHPVLFLSIFLLCRPTCHHLIDMRDPRYQQVIVPSTWHTS